MNTIRNDRELRLGPVFSHSGARGVVRLIFSSALGLFASATAWMVMTLPLMPRGANATVLPENQGESPRLNRHIHDPEHERYEPADDRAARRRALRLHRIRNDMRYGTDDYFGEHRDIWYADTVRPTPPSDPARGDDHDRDPDRGGHRDDPPPSESPPPSVPPPEPPPGGG